jgi:hypothetical protein
MSGVWKRSQGRTSEAPPDERGGNRYVRPTATAPHLDSTGLVALGALCIFGGWPVAWPAMHVLSLLLAGLAVWQAIAGRAGDLVEVRRRLRVILAIGAGLYIAAVVLAELMPEHGAGDISGTTTNAAGLTVIAFAFALTRVFEYPGETLVARSNQSVSIAIDRSVPAPIDAKEQALLDALRGLMERTRSTVRRASALRCWPSGSVPLNIGCGI